MNHLTDTWSPLEMTQTHVSTSRVSSSWITEVVTDVKSFIFWGRRRLKKYWPQQRKASLLRSVFSYVRTPRRGSALTSRPRQRAAAHFLSARCLWWVRRSGFIQTKQKPPPGPEMSAQGPAEGGAVWFGPLDDLIRNNLIWSGSESQFNTGITNLMMNLCSQSTVSFWAGMNLKPWMVSISNLFRNINLSILFIL